MQGDSGGPMSCLSQDPAEEGKWYVAGVASWGIITCSGVPGVFTRVSMYWEWIDLVMLLNAP